MLNDPLTAALHFTVGLVAGLVLGAFFFGGLWWTTLRLPDSQRPALLMMSSLLLRMGILALGLFFVSSAGPFAVVACGCGLLLVRSLLIRHASTLTAGGSS